MRKYACILSIINETTTIHPLMEKSLLIQTGKATHVVVNRTDGKPKSVQFGSAPYPNYKIVGKLWGASGWTGRLEEASNPEQNLQMIDLVWWGLSSRLWFLSDTIKSELVEVPLLQVQVDACGNRRRGGEYATLEGELGR